MYNFEELLESFLKYLIANRGYSDLTVKEYRYDLLLFMKYLIEKQKLPSSKIDVRKINKYEVGNYLADLILEKNNSPVTRNRRLFSLRSFFQYLLLHDLVQDDPTQHLVASKTMTNYEPIYLKLPEARNFISAIDTSKSKIRIRDLFIMKVFLYCGLRVGELVSLDLNDLSLHADGTIRVTGKGQKERVIPLHEELTNQAKEYLEWRSKIKIKTSQDQKALFLSLHGKRINVRTIQLMVKKYAQIAGLDNYQQLTPHKLRHTFATLLYKETKDIRVLQDLLGHESITTTQIYTHTDYDERRKILNQMPKL